jgi:hypothetical protein
MNTSPGRLTAELFEDAGMPVSGKTAPPVTMDLGCTLHPIEAAQAAWARIKERQTWNDWKTVGTAIAEGRTRAMVLALTNKPEGRRYNKEFKAWLVAHGFGDLEATTRKRLLQCMEHIDEIEAYLATFEIDKRLRLNHPATVLSAWKRATKSEDEESSQDEVEPEVDHEAQLSAAWRVAPPDARKAFLTKEVGLTTVFETVPEWRADATQQVLGNAEARAGSKGQRNAIHKLRRKRPSYLELLANPINN